MRRALPILLACLALASCRSASWQRTAVGPQVRFVLETSQSAEAARPGARDARAAVAPSVVVLPQSALRVLVEAEPVLSAVDFASVEVVERELGKGLLFVLKPEAATRLAGLSAAERSRRMVLLSGERPLGARRLDAAAAGNGVFVFVEVADADLPLLLQELKTGAGIRIRGGAK